MKLQFPLEILDATGQKGKAVSIGTVGVLFPAYKPITKTSLVGALDHLSDSNHHVSAEVYRWRNSNHVSVVLNEEYLLFSYLFDDVSDKYILKYLTRHQGWKKSVLPSIQKSLSYHACREDRAQQLYRWETKLPNVQVSYQDALDIIELEMLTHKVRINYDVGKIPSKKNSSSHGHCIVRRRAGWLSRPSEFEIGIRNNPMLFVVLHEIAHALDMHYFRCNNHGPTFMLTYASLLSKYMDIDALSSMAKAKLFLGERNAF